MTARATASHNPAQWNGLKLFGPAGRVLTAAEGRRVQGLFESQQFRRVGWNAADYTAWSDRMLDDGIAFVTPTSWNGEVVLRLCIVKPLTSIDDLGIIVDSLA